MLKLQRSRKVANVVLQNVKKVYGKDIVAVDNFNLDIKDKEFIVFVGPSGCGKSTTLRMVAGLEEISGGEVYIDDTLVNNLSPKDRDIAMVFQNYALYPHMTVYENMAFSLKLRKVPAAEIKERVIQAAEILDITNLLERKPKALSGGQRQRVAIGRAIVRNPKVFLMDEPLSNLDAKLRNLMRTEIIQLHQRLKTTFIYVTHDQIEAMTLGDRIVVMKDGFIQQIGTPQEVFSQPSNIFVAGFIGAPQMNFLDAKLIVEDGKYQVKFHGKRIELKEKYQIVLKDKDQRPCDIVLGIRPEDVLIDDYEHTNSFKAKVELSEMMGSEVYIHSCLFEKKIVLKVQTSKIDHDLNLYADGQDSFIYVKFNENMLHLFEKSSGENLIY